MEAQSSNSNLPLEIIELLKRLGMPDGYDLDGVANALSNDKTESPFEFIDYIHSCEYLRERDKIMVAMIKTFMMNNAAIHECAESRNLTATTSVIMGMLSGWTVHDILTLVTGIMTISTLFASRGDPVAASSMMMSCSDLMAMASDNITKQKPGYTMADISRGLQ